MDIRPATPADHDGIWAALEPVIRGGEHFASPREDTRDDTLAWWLAPGNVGRLSGAFAHPTLGDVGALVMYRAL